VPFKLYLTIALLTRALGRVFFKGLINLLSLFILQLSSSSIVFS
jgi:hypothetical protein